MTLGRNQGRREEKGKNELRKIMPLWREGKPGTNKIQETLSNVQYSREAKIRGFKLRKIQI